MSSDLALVLIFILLVQAFTWNEVSRIKRQIEETNNRLEYTSREIVKFIDWYVRRADDNNN